jgi:hypothetical protein
MAGAVAIAALAYFALDYVGVLSDRKDQQRLEQQQVVSAQISAQEVQELPSTSAETLSARTKSWTALLESVAATGEDKTKEIEAFLQGPPEEVEAVANRIQAQWSHGGSQDEGTLVRGSAIVAKAVMGPSLAGVLITSTLRLPDGSTARCVNITKWSLHEGEWCQPTWTGSYWGANTGRLPIEQGTQMDGVVWSLAKVEEKPTVDAAAAGDCVISVTLDARNQDMVRRTPADYSLCLWAPDGICHTASQLTDALFPTTKSTIQSSLLGGEECRFALAFEVPADTDLVTLEFEILPRSAASSSNSGGDSNESDNSPFLRLGTPKTWALATSAILMHREGLRDDLLGGASASHENVQTYKEGLAQWWGINKRGDLMEVLAWLEADGHRRVWDELAAYLASLSLEELEGFFSDAQSDPELANRIEVVRECGAKVGTKSLTAFDFCRYVSLCRQGYLCGYLSEEEAWERIMPAAAKLQGTYGSWAEVGENYLIGREFWSREETKRSGAYMREVYEGLLKDEMSPWLHNPWDMDLETAALGTT